jgi:hypothetical protein
MPTIQDDKLLVAPANLYIFEKPRASLSTTLTGTNNDLTVRATDIYRGAQGNNIQLAILGGTGTAVLSVAVSGTPATTAVINVTAARTASVITSTADQIIAAINTSPAAAALVTATRKTGDDGSGVVVALAAAPLTGGSDTPVETFLGGLLGEVTLRTVTDTIDVFAAQTGSIPRNTFVRGGSAQLSFTMAEITFENFKRATANALLFEQSSTVRRLDVGPQVGSSMRSLALQLKIVPLVGQAETPDLERTIIIPLAAPAAGEFPFTFSSEVQQGIPTTYQIFPDSVSNRLYFLGQPTL